MDLRGLAYNLVQHEIARLLTATNFSADVHYTSENSNQSAWHTYGRNYFSCIQTKQATGKQTLLVCAGYYTNEQVVVASSTSTGSNFLYTLKRYATRYLQGGLAEKC